MKTPPVPTGQSTEVVIMMRQELTEFQYATFQAGVERGRFEERNSEAPGNDAVSSPDDEPSPKSCTAETPCCDRRKEYNGFGSGRPLSFHCLAGCSCHD